MANKNNPKTRHIQADYSEKKYKRGFVNAEGFVFHRYHEKGEGLYKYRYETWIIDEAAKVKFLEKLANKKKNNKVINSEEDRILISRDPKNKEKQKEILTGRILEKFSEEIERGDISINFTNFERMHSVISIDCKYHGKINVTANVVWKSTCGCPRCSEEAGRKKTRTSKTKIVQQAREIYGDEYGYDLVKDDIGYREKMPIVCKKHGVFYKTPSDHICYKEGCRKCAYERASAKQTKTQEKFEEDASGRHDGRYGYGKFVYVNDRTKGIITCPKHGDFIMAPREHLNGQGCRHCSLKNPKTEKITQAILDAENIEYKKNIRCLLIGQTELDFYMEDRGAAIETCGEYWHSAAMKKRKDHISKHNACEERGIRLLTLMQNEFHRNVTGLTNLIYSWLKINAKIPENISFKESSEKEFRTFTKEKTIEKQAKWDKYMVATESGEPIAMFGISGDKISSPVFDAQFDRGAVMTEIVGWLRRNASGIVEATIDNRFAAKAIFVDSGFKVAKQIPEKPICTKTKKRLKSVKGVKPEHYFYNCGYTKMTLEI